MDRSGGFSSLSCRSDPESMSRRGKTSHNDRHRGLAAGKRPSPWACLSVCQNLALNHAHGRTSNRMSDYIGLVELRQSGKTDYSEWENYYAGGRGEFELFLGRRRDDASHLLRR